MRRFSNLSLEEREAAEKAAIASQVARAEYHRARAEAFAASLGTRYFADGPCWYTAVQEVLLSTRLNCRSIRAVVLDPR